MIGSGFNGNIDEVAISLPEPASAAMGVLLLGGLGFRRSRRR
jgi:MYXO-CTERM domain-containing protein